MNKNMVGIVPSSPQDDRVDSDELAIEITKARQWLRMVVQQLDVLDCQQRQQYDYTLFWVNTQQKVLDELEGWE